MISLIKNIFILALISGAANATGIDIQDRINMQKVYLKTYDAMFGSPKYSRVDEFTKLLRTLSAKNKQRALNLTDSLQDKITPKVLMPLVYWYLIQPNKNKLSDVLTHAMYYKMISLRDVIDNPLSKKSFAKMQATMKQRRFLASVDVKQKNLSLYTNWRVKEKVQAILLAKGDGDFVTRILSDELLVSHEKSDQNYALSWLGYIPGNKVELISENDRSLERIQWVNKRALYHNFGKGIDWSKPYFKMPENHGDKGNPIFHDPIFAKIRDMIRDANDSIFIDIFLMGGTMGASIAKYLVDKTIKQHKQNKNFKTLLLHDFSTHYNMLPELMPVFEYLQKQITTNAYLKDCKCMYLLQANIHRHPPGIPFGLSNFVERNKDTCKAMESKSTYYESKIDHSKVIVTDAHTDAPKAYFGSKNWSDHSGSYYYDDAIYVEGPAAALVQYSYASDVEAALTTVENEKMCFYFKEKGFSNDKYLKSPYKEKITQLMTIKKKTYPRVGNQVVRFAEANVDGRIKNARNILIEMIMNAGKNIYMEQLFIYDRYINDALIKRKVQMPDLDIRILADHNGNFHMNGLPNTIFMEELLNAGIKIRAYNTAGKDNWMLPDGSTQGFHQENHRKITSVDGKVILGGSSNLNADTLQGSFREFGAQIFDLSIISKYEEKFKSSWDNNELTADFEVKNLKFKDTELDEQLSTMILRFVSQLLRSKDDLEKRN